MTPQELEQALEKAKTDLADWRVRGIKLHECSHTWMDGMSQRTEAVLQAERALHAARGQDYAAACDDGIALRLSVLPRIFRREGNIVTLLAVVSYVPPEWKGKIVGEENWGYSDDRPVLRIEYSQGTVQTRKPEDVEKHPLYERGLDPGSMMQIHHPGRQTQPPHFLIMFDGAWVEITGVPKPAEIWAVTLDEVARHCAGTAVPL